MGNKDINVKRRLLEFIDKLTIEGDMTIYDLISSCREDIEDYDTSVEDKEMMVINEFNNSYLKFKEDNTIFGEELIILHINIMEVNSFTIDFTRMYKVGGTKISFDIRGTHMGEIQYHENQSEEELRSYQVITEQEFNEYKEKRESIISQLKNII